MRVLIDCKYPFERGELNKSAFYLHQATESFYSSILLVFSNYKPKLHDIEELGSMAENYNSELLQVFPIATPEQKNVLSYFKKLVLMQDMIKTIKLLKNSCFVLLKE